MSRSPNDPRNGRPDLPGQEGAGKPKGGPSRPGGIIPGAPEQKWRWVVLVLVGLVVLVTMLSALFQPPARRSLSYTELINSVNAGQVRTADINNNNGRITGELADGTRYSAEGPNPLLPNDAQLFRDKGVAADFSTP